MTEHYENMRRRFGLLELETEVQPTDNTLLIIRYMGGLIELLSVSNRITEKEAEALKNSHREIINGLLKK